MWSLSDQPNRCLPKHLQSTQKILELIDGINSDLSNLSRDDATEQIPTTSSVRNQQQSEYQLSDSSSDDETLFRNVQWKRKSSFSHAVTKFTNPPDAVNRRADWKPTDSIMQMYLDKQLFSHISQCTNVTSVAVKGKSLNTTPAETERFIGACLFMLCLSYSPIRHSRPVQDTDAGKYGSPSESGNNQCEKCTVEQTTSYT